jgi:hypothetical protein
MRGRVERHAINDCDVTDLVTDALSPRFESVREAIGQEFVTLLEGYGLDATIDRCALASRARSAVGAKAPAIVSLTRRPSGGDD